MGNDAGFHANGARVHTQTSTTTEPGWPRAGHSLALVRGHGRTTSESILVLVETILSAPRRCPMARAAPAPRLGAPPTPRVSHLPRPKQFGGAVRQRASQDCASVEPSRVRAAACDAHERSIINSASSGLRWGPSRVTLELRPRHFWATPSP
eukprot:9497029-Pyramimonas_sp.AAC.1